MRPVLGTVIIVLVAIALWRMPWQALAAGLFSDENDAIPWIAADGNKYPPRAFPELYAAFQGTAFAKGDVVRVPNLYDAHDFLANAQFGSRLLYRCIATHKLEDNTPAGTLGWCTPHGK